VLDALKVANSKDATFFALLHDRKDESTGMGMPTRDAVKDAALAAGEADSRLWDAIQADLHRAPSERVASRSRPPLSEAPGGSGT
jgi:hypothetical protein